MKYAIKLKLKPNAEQIAALDGQSRICNWLYNHMLGIANNLKQEYVKTKSDETALILYSKRGLRDLLPTLKKEKAFLKTVHCKPLKNAVLRLSRAIQDYQKSKKGKRRGPLLGWPRFSKWKQNWFSLHYCEPWNGYKLMNGSLRLSLGKDEKGKQIRLAIPISESRVLKDKKVKTLEIVKEYGCYYACFVVEQANLPKKTVRKIIAIDPNHKNIGYGVDNKKIGFEIEHVKKLIKKQERKIDYLKSRRDLCDKKSKKFILKESGKTYGLPSRRWLVFDKALQKAYFKKREQIKHLLYALANKLYSRYDLVMVGDYTPQPGSGISRGMRRSMNNQTFIGKMKQVFEHVGNKSGKHYLEYDEHHTTIECHACGTLNRNLTVEDRTWKCHTCGLEHIRDENAAINGLRTKTNIMSRSDLFGVTQRCTWQWNFSNWMLLAKELNDKGGTLSAMHRFI